MAGQRKTTTGSKASSAKSRSKAKTGTAGSNGTKKTRSSAAGRKTTRSAASSNGTGKTTQKRTRSTASKATAKKAETKTAAPKAAAKPPAKGEAENWTTAKEPVKPKKPARVAAAESTAPSLRPAGRRTGWMVPAMIGVLLVGIGIVVILVATSGSDDNNTSNGSVAPPPPIAEPVAPVAPPASSAKPKPKPAPAAQVQHCQPIFGGGAAHSVTSSAKGGASPASCSEAHSVLLTALNNRTASVGSWRCQAQPSSGTLASCTSGKRTIVASG
jgi:hypothetical protein